MIFFLKNYLLILVDFRMHCLVCLVIPKPHEVEQGVQDDHEDHSPQNIVSFDFQVKLISLELSLP